MKRLKDKNGKYINYRHRQMIFRRCLMIISIFTISLGIAFGASVLTSNAREIDEPNYFKYYTSVMVYSGDSIYSIYEEYGDHFESFEDFKKEVFYSNHMTDDKIIAGQNLIVPYYSVDFK